MFLDSKLTEHTPSDISVLMPARAFFVFGLAWANGGVDTGALVLMPARAFFVFGPTILFLKSESLIVLMPARAFFVFGPYTWTGVRAMPIVLMPARAFFVFGQKFTYLSRAIVMRSNAREGIFCFWTLFVNATKNGRFSVLMPARAFFVFGQIEGASHLPNSLMF